MSVAMTGGRRWASGLIGIMVAGALSAQTNEFRIYSAATHTGLLADAAGYTQLITRRDVQLEVMLIGERWHKIEIMGASPCEYTSIDGVALGRSHSLAGNTSGDCVIINGTSVSVSRSGEDVTLSFSPHAEDNKIVLRQD